MPIIYTPSAVGDTFSDLVDKVLAYDYGTRDRDVIKGWINQTYRDLSTKKRWNWTEAEAAISTVASQTYVDLQALADPPAFYGRIRPGSTDMGAAPEYVDNLQDYEGVYLHYAVPSSIGRPSRYTIWAGRVYFDPTPDAVYSYNLYYWAYVPDMINDEDYALVPPEFRNLLVYGALYHAAMRDRDPQMAQQWQTEYFAGLDAMKHMDSLRESETTERVFVQRASQRRAHWHV